MNINKRGVKGVDTRVDGKVIIDEHFDKMMREVLIKSDKALLAEFTRLVMTSDKKKRFKNAFLDLMLVFCLKKFGGDK